MKRYEVVKILKKQVLGEFSSDSLEWVRDLVIKTYGPSKNIIIYEIPPKDNGADV